MGRNFDLHISYYNSYCCTNHACQDVKTHHERLTEILIHVFVYDRTILLFILVYTLFLYRTRSQKVNLPTRFDISEQYF